MGKQTRIQIFFPPFRSIKEIPIRFSIPRYDSQYMGYINEYTTNIRSLKPLSFDLIEEEPRGSFKISQRSDQRAIVYIDDNKLPHVICPHFTYKNIPYEIEIDPANKNKLEEGTYWLVTLPIQQTRDSSKFRVRLEKEFRRSDVLSREIEMVKEYYGLPVGTPEAPREERENYKRIYENTLSDHLIQIRDLKGIDSLKEDKNRYDFRDRTIYTIDGETTKDIDDAIEVEEIGKDHFLLGIHIADVSEFIKEGTERDKDAFNRGTSHYLADTVIHMLPEILSQEYCSLNENYDRLAFSVFVEVVIENNMPVIKGVRFVNSIIRSKAKLTYKNVESFFKSQRNEDSIFELGESLNVARKLANFFMQESKRRAIGSDSKNIKYYLDNNGKINRKVDGMDESNKLIEMFMITANQMAGEKMADAVASISPIANTGIGVYRFQTVPSYRDLEEYVNKLKFAQLINRRFDIKTNYDSIKDMVKQDKNLNKRLSVEEREAYVLSQLYRKINNEIREIEKNRTKRLLYVIGKKEISSGRVTSPASFTGKFSKSYHLSLGISRYAWFTSPIRRYSDIVNHRQIKAIIGTGKPVQNNINIEDMERRFKNADSAEKFLNNRLLMFYLIDQKGLDKQRQIQVTTSFFRWVNTTTFVIHSLWQDEYEIPLFFSQTLPAEVQCHGLKCTFNFMDKKVFLNINDEMRISLSREESQICPDKGYILIRDPKQVAKI